MPVTATESVPDTSRIASGRRLPDTTTTKSITENSRAIITTRFTNNGGIDVDLGPGAEKITPRDLMKAMNRTLKLIRLCRQAEAKKVLNV